MPTTEPSSSDSLCIAAATALLNCVTSKDYETSRCQEQLEALRTCTKKQVGIESLEGVHMIVARHRPLSFGHPLPVQHVVDFNLRPTAGASKQ